MNRPTCGTCPHRVGGSCYLQPAEWQDGGMAPIVKDDRPGCQHHPRMGKWLASLEAPVVPTVADAATAADAAELEQWRKVAIWYKDSIDRAWSLMIVRTGATLAYVAPRDGDWLVGRRGPRYPSRDAAMRAAEAAFGLPKCRVEGECT